jgi:hypothetical protein
MGDVLYLVAFAQTDDAGKVILHDSQVIAMVVDVCRQQQRIAPAHNPLLAEVGRLPIHF